MNDLYYFISIFTISFIFLHSLLYTPCNYNLMFITIISLGSYIFSLVSCANCLVEYNRKTGENKLRSMISIWRKSVNTNPQACPVARSRYLSELNYHKYEFKQKLFHTCLWYFMYYLFFTFTENFNLKNYCV